MKSESESLFTAYTILAILSHASLILSTEIVNAHRMYPSPYLPNPIPGVTMTPLSRSLLANAIESDPQFAQT